MTDLTIDKTPAKIQLNYDEVREQLEKELEQYRFVVTADTVKDAKAKAAELNSLKKDLDTRRKQAIAEVSAPIKAADDQMKSLVALYTQGYQDIMDQVKRFEDATKKDIAEKLAELRDRLWLEHQVQDDFKAAEFDDLILLTSVTGKGAITAKAGNELLARVQQDKAKQQATELRLERLKSQSYEAGLAAPLERQHVEAFLFANEDEYNRRLELLMAAELNREQIARDRMRAQQQREQQAKPVSQPEPGPQPEPPQAPAKPNAEGKVPVTVLVRFDMMLDASTADETIKQKFDAMMKKANITAPYTLDVERGHD